MVVGVAVVALFTEVSVHNTVTTPAHPDRSPSDVVAVEELLDVDAVRNETFERYRVHVDGVSKHD